MKYFKDSEFVCPCGCGLGINNMDPIALEDLQRARDTAGIPFVITSSIRCPKHNEAVGGAKASSHLYGFAFDIKCTNSVQRLIMIKAFLKTRFTRIGVGTNFIHVDCDPAKHSDLMWVY